MTLPQTRYARSGEVRIAYQVVGQGLGHLWAQDGTLLGTASQSISVRRWPGDRAVVSGAALSKTGHNEEKP